MKKSFFIILLIMFPMLAFSQLEITLTTIPETIYVEDGDTLSVCIDSTIIFEVVTVLEGDTITGASFYWDFDDGNTISDIDKDSVSHTYSEGGGYRVKLTVIFNEISAFTIQPVKIAFPPDYSGTKPDIPEEQNGICRGSAVSLIGKAVPKLWEDEPVYIKEEDPPKEFSDIKIYESTLTFDEFPLGSVFDVGYIDSLGVNIEHSDMGNVQIKLICPNGNSAVLKNYNDTNHAYFGEPVDDENSDEYGIGYNYYWSESASENINLISENPIPAAAYFPDELFSNFNTCPLNGSWKIEITDNSAENNGFIFSWNLVFNKDILPPVWTFKDTLLQYYQYEDESIAGTYWSGKNIGSTSLQTIEDTIKGVAIAEPDIYGNNGYIFHVVNNWGCPTDTMLSVRVEPVSASANPETAEANTDSVEFESTTSWGENFNWEFGDDSDDNSGETTNHLYEEIGTYSVILTVSDGNACTDRDTLQIEITVEISELQEVPNIFTPNDDSKNDFLKFDVKGMEYFYFVIYSRWGQKVYETDSQEEMKETGWDGKMSFTKFKASPGVYFYIVQARGKDKEEYERKGTIHLLR